MEAMGQPRMRNGQGGGGNEFNLGNLGNGGNVGNDGGPDPDAIKMFVGQVPRSMDEVSRLEAVSALICSHHKPSLLPPCLLFCSLSQCIFSLGGTPRILQRIWSSAPAEHPQGQIHGGEQVCVQYILTEKFVSDFLIV